MGQLLTKTTNTALYWGGISSIIAWWMPSPGEVAQKRSAIALNSNHDSNLTVNENVPSNPTVITTNSTQNGSHSTLDRSVQFPIN